MLKQLSIYAENKKGALHHVASLTSITTTIRRFICYDSERGNCFYDQKGGR